MRGPRPPAQLTKTGFAGAGVLCYSAGIMFAYLRLAPGLTLAALSLLLNLGWAAAIKPLNTPDEPAISGRLAVRTLNILPEVHYEFPTPTGRVVGWQGDPAVQAYTQQQGGQGTFVLIPYEGMQPPLYYALVGGLAQALPPDPAWGLALGAPWPRCSGRPPSIFAGQPPASWCRARPAGGVGGRGGGPAAPIRLQQCQCGNDRALNCLCAASYYVWLRGLRQPAGSLAAAGRGRGRAGPAGETDRAGPAAGAGPADDLASGGLGVGG